MDSAHLLNRLHAHVKAHGVVTDRSRAVWGEQGRVVNGITTLALTDAYSKAFVVPTKLYVYQVGDDPPTFSMGGPEDLITYAHLLGVCDE